MMSAKLLNGRPLLTTLIGEADCELDLLQPHDLACIDCGKGPAPNETIYYWWGELSLIWPVCAECHRERLSKPEEYPSKDFAPEYTVAPLPRTLNYLELGRVPNDDEAQCSRCCKIFKPRPDQYDGEVEGYYCDDCTIDGIPRGDYP